MSCCTLLGDAAANREASADLAHLSAQFLVLSRGRNTLLSTKLSTSPADRGMKRRFRRKNSPHYQDDKGEKNEKRAYNWSRKLYEKFKRFSGFEFDDLCSFERFTDLMYRPTDSASLGVVRALFGECF